LEQFAEELSKADEVIILPIYSAREKDDGSISSEDLVRRIETFGGDVFYANNFKEATDKLKKETKKEDVIIAMGAGDVYKISEKLTNKN